MQTRMAAKVARAAYSVTPNPKEKMEAAVMLIGCALREGFPFPADVDGEQYARMAKENARKAVREFDVGAFAGT